MTLVSSYSYTGLAAIGSGNAAVHIIASKMLLFVNIITVVMKGKNIYSTLEKKMMKTINDNKVK